VALRENQTTQTYGTVRDDDDDSDGLAIALSSSRKLTGQLLQYEAGCHLSAYGSVYDGAGLSGGGP